jgi:hypothetical protein
MQLIDQEQQRQAELEAFAQQQQHTKAVAATAAEEATPLLSAASNSSSTGGSGKSRRVRFSTDADQIVLIPKTSDNDEAFVRTVSMSAGADLNVDRDQVWGSAGSGRAAAAAAAVAAVLGVQRKASEGNSNSLAPNTARISSSSDGCSSPIISGTAATASVQEEQSGVALIPLVLASQQAQLQHGCQLAADQQLQQQQLQPMVGELTTAANAALGSQRQEATQKAAAAAAAVGAPMSPFGNLKDLPWD